MRSDDDDDDDSLFGSDSTHEAVVISDEDVHNDVPVASRTPPSIPGLFFFPDLLSRDLHDRVLQQVSACGYFALSEVNESQENSRTASYARSSRNQAMLFARSLAPSPDTQPGGPSSAGDSSCSGLPAWAIELIHELQSLLCGRRQQDLPRSVKNLLFPSDQLLSRQLILNLYTAAEGLSPHVDLVNRFADGILLCSFGPQGTGTVMEFTHEREASEHLFLPSGSVLVLSGEARYEWMHGISARAVDLVRAADGRVVEMKRSIRLSVTIRSMLPGADIVGE